MNCLGYTLHFIEKVEFMSSVRKKIKLALNRSLRWVFYALATDFYASLPKGSLFVIAPHPDDETFGCGTLIARSRQDGRDVRVLIITDGAAATSAQTKPSHALAILRREETQKAAKILGVEDDALVFLNYPDGEADKHSPAIANAIALHLSRQNPVALFSPYGLDAHNDHRAIAKTIDSLCQEGRITIPVFEYPMWFWPCGAIRQLFFPRTWHPVRKISTQGFLAQKEQAIHAHKSQCETVANKAHWTPLPSAFLQEALQPYELFFEKPRAHAQVKEKASSS